MDTTISETLHKEALKHIVGGVNSPSRSYKAVNKLFPIVMKRAKGAYFWDVDDNKYIDYLSGYGPIIAGHAHPHIFQAVSVAAKNGTLFGTLTEHEIIFAKMLKKAIQSLERVRLTNSGTEAVMSTIRLARSFTGRTKIIKFAGCYHGHFDSVLVAAGSGPSTLSIPDSAGVPSSTAEDVITVPFNDINAFAIAMKKWENQVAAVLIEPIVGNFGLVCPTTKYLQTLKEITHKASALLIFDEVITGFRFTYGGAQDLLGVSPDLTALGKIIGGGLPIGAYGGRAEIMEHIAPNGATYQAGTMAGNPVSVSAGIACLEILQAPNFYEKIDALGELLETGLLDLAKKHGVPITVNRLKGMLAIYFADVKVTNYDEAKLSDDKMFAQFFDLMLNQGIHIAPSKYETWFITASHTEADISTTLKAVDYAFKIMAISR